MAELIGVEELPAPDRGPQVRFAVEAGDGGVGVAVDPSGAVAAGVVGGDGGPVVVDDVADLVLGSPEVPDAAA